MTGTWDSSGLWNHGGFESYDVNVSTSQIPVSSTVVSGIDTYTFTGPSTLSSQDDYYKWAGIQLASAFSTTATNYLVIGYTGATRTFHLGVTQALPSVPAPGTPFQIVPNSYLADPTNTNAVAAPLNNLIGPAYAWYYWYTANVLGTPNISYREQFDAIFDGAWVAWNDPPNQKGYNQEYRWSFQGLKWRARGDAEWAAATSYTLTAPTPASGQASAPSGAFLVSTPASTCLVTPVTITPHASTSRGTFIPATVVLSSDHPFGLFRFFPDPADASAGLTITTTNGGGLTNPAGLGYTVGTAAPIATGHTITGPASGGVGLPATFTLATVPTGSVMPVTWVQATGGIDTVFASDGSGLQTFNMPNPGPTWKVWASSERLSQTFTYTPATTGSKSLTFTLDSLGLPDTGLTFNASPVATSYSLTAPSLASGLTGQASGSFTLVPNGPYAGTITPADGAGGTFTPASLSWTGDASSRTFTYTPATPGTMTIATTSLPALTNPAPVTFNAIAVATSYTLAVPNPSSGRVGNVSGAFTVALSPAGSRRPVARGDHARRRQRGRDVRTGQRHPPAGAERHVHLHFRGDGIDHDRVYHDQHPEQPAGGVLQRDGREPEAAPHPRRAATAGPSGVDEVGVT